MQFSYRIKLYFCVKFTQLKIRTMSYTYKYPHPAVAADCVVFGFDGRDLQILLIQRGLDPFKGAWAFPGGFMNIDESAEECAHRELQEETSLNVKVLKQLGAFSAVHRDPRERVVSIAFYALVRPSEVKGGDDASQACWFALRDVPQLAFDHDFILRKAMQRLREDIYFEPVSCSTCMRQFLEFVSTAATLRRKCSRRVFYNWRMRTNRTYCMTLVPWRVSRSYRIML